MSFRLALDIKNTVLNQLLDGKNVMVAGSGSDFKIMRNFLEEFLFNPQDSIDGSLLYSKQSKNLFINNSTYMFVMYENGAKFHTFNPDSEEDLSYFTYIFSDKAAPIDYFLWVDSLDGSSHVFKDKILPILSLREDTKVRTLRS